MHAIACIPWNIFWQLLQDQASAGVRLGAIQQPLAAPAFVGGTLDLTKTRAPDPFKLCCPVCRLDISLAVRLGYKERYKRDLTPGGSVSFRSFTWPSMYLAWLDISGQSLPQPFTITTTPIVSMASHLHRGHGNHRHDHRRYYHRQQHHHHIHHSTTTTSSSIITTVIIIIIIASSSPTAP